MPLGNGRIRLQSSRLQDVRYDHPGAEPTGQAVQTNSL